MLLDIAGHVVEWQHGHGAACLDDMPAGLGRGIAPRLGHVDAKDGHRFGNILEVVLAEVDQFGARPVTDRRRSRECYSARLCRFLQPGRDVHRIAENVVVVLDYLADVNADTEFHAPIVRENHVSFSHLLLHFAHGHDGGDGRGKLDQHAVAGGLYDTSAVVVHERVDGVAVCLQRGQRSVFLCAHEP